MASVNVSEKEERIDANQEKNLLASLHPFQEPGEAVPPLLGQNIEELEA